MKKLIFSILLLIGCSRDYICDGHIQCPDDSGAGRIDGSQCDIGITVDWPDGEKKAEEECEEILESRSAIMDSLRDEWGVSDLIIVSPGDTLIIADSVEVTSSSHNCICEKAD